MALATVPEIQGGNAEVLDERRVVRTRTERIDPEITPLASVALFIGLTSKQQQSPLTLGHADFLLWIDDIPCHFVNEPLQRMRAAHIEESAPVGIRVYVDGCLIL